MAKQKSRKGKGSYATYAAENRALTNKKRKVAKHLAKHPNDKQTAEKAQYNPRRASNTKGNYPDQKFYWYDGAGQKFLIVPFEPFERKK